jgi:hypothetical protein
MTGERMPVWEYVNYCSDGGLDGHGSASRKDNKQRCWDCGARRRKHRKVIEGSVSCKSRQRVTSTAG